ncbi:hypothetical protein ALP72_02112 [Pseudomonas coronafaciens pv. coronafaciens]|uniref:hypothetical protein n=1 Tax=Pseudomonas coronafaciens TaxID=53409 RepID=UPI000EFDBE84|nr:hypothetical protein [Pseudomonas coronafaciens]RMS14543.1 hypothetical protein ALP72_02112 [Pseudomonas coronafaciens pv. coronafaciens]
MSIEKVREEYEAWVLSKYPNQHMGRFATGEYHSTVIEHCWQAWQASREALVIELPAPYAVIGDYAACGGGRSVWDAEYAKKIDDRMCEKTPVYDLVGLKAAGLRLKP